MAQYIDKSALIAEIAKNKNEMEPERDWHFDEYTNGYIDALKDILSFINTLEVKEVDSTDAFIDKACEWLKENKDHPLIGCEDICLSGYLTDEFIEDFKNYMKGE